MVTTEEQITYLAQHLNAMQTDVAELQNVLQGSATRYAEPVDDFKEMDRRLYQVLIS